MYVAARDGSYVNPHKVEDILRVPRDEQTGSEQGKGGGSRVLN